MTQPAQPSEPIHPVILAMRRAPLVNELTPEQRAELDQDLEDLRAGRMELTPHQEIEAWLEAQRSTLGPQDE